MIQFVKDSIRELKHVVWPTRAETRKYFMLVVTLLTLFGLYLFAFSNLFSNIVFWLKDLIGIESTSNVSSSMSDEEIQAIINGNSDDNVNLEITATGSTGLEVESESIEITESTATGAENQ